VSRRRAIALLAAALALTAAPAGAHTSRAPALSLPVLGDLGPVTELPNGLFEVALRTGAPLTVHGSDPAAGDGTELTAQPRPPKCADAPHDRVLYGRPALSLDGLTDASARIQEIMWRVNGALDEAAVESGGRHADLRVRCDGDGLVRIDSFVNPLSGSFADVVDAARLAGATDPGADYVIFYEDDAPDACGVGSFTDDDRPAAANVNNEGGGYAVIYSDCWNGVTALHEIAHTQGAVQPGSPFGTGQGHCRDGLDVMCYADGAEGAAGMLALCDEQRFDCGYDDYFDVAPEPGEYLESHWNLGSPLNRFIELGDDAAGASGEDAGCALAPTWMTPEVCDADEEIEEPPMRILSLGRVRGNTLRLALACPYERTGRCRGRVELRAPGDTGRLVARRRRVALPAGERTRIAVRLLPGARRRWAAGRLRRLRVTVDEDAIAVRARRTIALRGTRAHRAR
jgi:hypothetical protein